MNREHQALVFTLLKGLIFTTISIIVQTKFLSLNAKLSHCLRELFAFKRVWFAWSKSKIVSVVQSIPPTSLSSPKEISIIYYYWKSSYLLSQMSFACCHLSVWLTSSKVRSVTWIFSRKLLIHSVCFIFFINYNSYMVGPRKALSWKVSTAIRAALTLLRLTVKICQFLRPTATLLAVLRLTVNFINTLTPHQICNFPYCQPYSSYNISSENFALDQLIITKLIFFLYSHH